jgi:uroporphyrinogen decarboxylase
MGIFSNGGRWKGVGRKTGGTGWPGMDCAELKAKYGNRLIFHGGVENQKILPFGTPEEVAAETRTCLEQLGPDGYLPCSCHFAQADTPLENVMALIRTVREFRP